LAFSQRPHGYREEPALVFDGRLSSTFGKIEGNRCCSPVELLPQGAAHRKRFALAVEICGKVESSEVSHIDLPVLKKKEFFGSTSGGDQKIPFFSKPGAAK
jgi:hypothetical protein